MAKGGGDPYSPLPASDFTGFTGTDLSVGRMNKRLWKMEEAHEKLSAEMRSLAKEMRDWRIGKKGEEDEVRSLLAEVREMRERDIHCENENRKLRDEVQRMAEQNKRHRAELEELKKENAELKRLATKGPSLSEDMVQGEVEVLVRN